MTSHSGAQYLKGVPFRKAVYLKRVLSAFAGSFMLRRRTRQSRERAEIEAVRQCIKEQKEEFGRELVNAEAKFRVLFDHSSEAYLLVDGTSIIDCNQSAVRMLRASGKQQIVGRSPEDFAPELTWDTGSCLDPLQPTKQLSSEPELGRIVRVYSRLDGSDLHVEVTRTAIPLRGKALTLVAWYDLTERRKAEEALLHSAARLRIAQDIVRLGHWEYDTREDRMLWSEEALRMFGLPSEPEMRTLQNCLSRIHPDDRTAARQALRSALGRGKPVEVYFRVVLPDGNIRHIDFRSRSHVNSAGTVVRVAGTILDISEQKQVEARLRQTLAEKELLVKEVHHRVKNNLQVISSLLSMQIDLLEDEDSIRALRESQHRISSMALIHERLYSDGNIDNVDFAEYTETLVQELFHAYGKQAQYIHKNLDLAPVPLNIEKAIPCGLILNELVTNALKHAFPSGRGTLNIKLKGASKHRVSLCVSDTGIGLPEDLNLKNSKSLGLPLVEVLARQLGGILHVQSKPGATFTVEFPVLE